MPLVYGKRLSIVLLPTYKVVILIFLLDREKNEAKQIAEVFDLAPSMNVLLNQLALGLGPLSLHSLSWFAATQEVLLIRKITYHYSYMVKG